MLLEQALPELPALLNSTVTDVMCVRAHNFAFKKSIGFSNAGTAVIPITRYFSSTPYCTYNGRVLLHD